MRGNLQRKVRGFCSAVILSATFAFGLTPSTQALSLLHTSGRNIVNASNTYVHFTGFNLGGWLVMEKWMCPLDSGSIGDTYGVLSKLDSRFGVATEQSMMKSYESSWITTTDLDNIKNAGYNCVRVPVWWGDFFTLASYGDSSGWRSDAFERLDWLVSACGSRNIYVVIDMHGVVGGQSSSDDTGRANQNAYWGNGSYQGRTAFMWWQIANHYKGNATIAGYDLINEPIGAPNSSTVWARYNDLYNTIRGVDTTHMIFMEGAYGSWNWSMLPAPSTYGWTNVVYEMHEYNPNNVTGGAQNQVNDFNNHASWNVPCFIGEYNCYGTGKGTWDSVIQLYNNNNLNWTMWSYKATHGLNTDSWGWYDPSSWKTTPNISTDAQSTITNDWAQWATTNGWVKNSTVL